MDKIKSCIFVLSNIMFYSEIHHIMGKKNGLQMPSHVDFNVTDFHLMHKINFKPGCDHIFLYYMKNGTL